MRWAPEAKFFYRLWSVRFAAAGAVFSVAQVVFPGLLNFVNPLERPQLYGLICAGFLLATLVARLVDQPSLPDA